MGLFGNKSKTEETKQTEIQSLLQMEIKEGEFTLKNFLWGHLAKYKFTKEKERLCITGDKYFKPEQLKKLVDDFVEIFGIDSISMEGKWGSEQDEFNLAEFGTASRAWYLDDNFDCKPSNSDFFLNHPKDTEYKRIIFIDADKNDDEMGLQLTIIGWTEIKEFLKTRNARSGLPICI